MIQEIYDYLLTRSNFMFDKEAMIEGCKNKDEFKYIIHNICLLMQEENFFLAYPEVLENVSVLVQKYRFDYNKYKEINDDMNFIIERTNKYNAMSIKRKRYLVNDWLKKEFLDRDLPFLLQTKECITEACMNEVHIFATMCGYKLSEDGKSYEYAGDDSDIVIETSAINFLQTVNLLANRYPCFYYDEYNLKNALYNVEALLTTKPNHLLLRYIKCTLKTLKKLEKEIVEFDDEVIKELKKTNN